MDAMWLSVDPLAEKFPSVSPYVYTLNNPINLIDPDGREPIKYMLVLSAMFRALLNNSPRELEIIQDRKGELFESLGNTEFSWKQMRPLPTQTGYFNKKEGRYIYTEKGGWMDMAHFMFLCRKGLRI